MIICIKTPIYNALIKHININIISLSIVTVIIDNKVKINGIINSNK